MLDLDLDQIARPVGYRRPSCSLATRLLSVDFPNWPDQTDELIAELHRFLQPHYHLYAVLEDDGDLAGCRRVTDFGRFGFHGLAFPKVFEWTRTQFAVARGMFDVHMSNPQLKPPRILARVRQQVPALATACADARRATLRVRP
jgi:hypothetical protein